MEIENNQNDSKMHGKLVVKLRSGTPKYTISTFASHTRNQISTTLHQGIPIMILAISICSHQCHKLW